MKPIDKALSFINGSDCVILVNDVRSFRLNQTPTLERNPVCFAEPLKRIGMDRESWAWIKRRTTAAEYAYLVEASTSLFALQNAAVEK